MPEKIRPQSEKNSITKKLINFKQASIFPSKALTDLNMHRDDTISLSHSEENYNRNISGSSKLLESEQPSNLITAAGNKYNAIKNCLNTIKDTFTKGKLCCISLVKYSPFYQMCVTLFQIINLCTMY